METEWREIPGFPRYELSNKGMLYDTLSSRVIVITYKTTGDGYPAIMLKSPEGKMVRRRLHRLLAETFLPNPLNRMWVNHKDGNKQNFELSNLEWCTPSDNIQHAYDTKLRVPITGVSGENNHFAKLTNANVESVKLLLRQKVPRSEIARMFNVSYSNIYLIDKNKSRKEG